MTGLTLAPEVALPVLAYGEEIQPGTARSLGYRLLLPAEPDAVADEVQALARRLQAAPYSDHWPATDLFCSILLGDGRRLVAMVRYGLLDHTATRRRGGLELLGVLTPASLSAAQAVQLYRGLVAKRGDGHAMPAFPPALLVHDLQAAASPPPTLEPLPILPVRLWQAGPMLFVAGSPSDPDQHLRLLDQASSSQWQWLPLVGPDFPFATYAKRGPLLAWTPHQTGVAIQLDADPPAPPPEEPAWPHWLPWAQLGLLGLIAVLLFVNLLLTWRLAAR
jgi:hypothetical protein